MSGRRAHNNRHQVPDCDAITVAAVEAAEYTMLSRDERKE